MKLVARLVTVLAMVVVAEVSYAQCDMNDKSCGPAKIDENEAKKVEVAECDMGNVGGCGPAKVDENDAKKVELACQDMDERAGCGPAKIDENDAKKVELACENPSCMYQPDFKNVELACNNPSCATDIFSQLLHA